MLLRRIGAPLIEVPPAENFDHIRINMRKVARAVGEEAKGEALLAEMDAALVELARTKPDRRILVASWAVFGGIAARGTLFDSILTAAGGQNSATQAVGADVAFDLEQVVAMRPDILAYGNFRLEQPDLAAERLRHPVIQKLFAGRQISYPETLYNCGLPQSATIAARDLRRAMLDIMARIGRRIE
jgi:iron complex transport system substrate-binding protein